MFKVNPYRPGAGLQPPYLAGRDEDVQNVEKIFKALLMGYPVQSIIFSGLRGVGKTVLINHLYEKAEEKGIFCKHIEVEERRDFIPQIVSCSQAFLRKINNKEKFKHLVQKGLDVIKTLVISYDPNSGGYSLSVQEQELYKTISLTQSLTDLFTTLGEAARKSETPICFFIDEIQYMKPEELGSLIAALHRCNQLGYPIMIIGAGLPRIFKMLSDEKSYSERLFQYKEIGSLSNEQARKAIEEPAKDFDTVYTKDAVEKIIEATKGYPFFIQQLCQIVYENSNNNKIDLEDVNNNIDSFFRILDSGFFRVRYERCAENDKKFLFAMVKCGELPCTISNIAKNLRKTTNQISTTRAQLINKGIIYPVKYKELDFTVPEFDKFIQRREEYKEWCNEY